MNKQRRKTLNEALGYLDSLSEAEGKEDAYELISKVIYSVELCADEEEMALDSMPEQLRYASAGDAMSDNIADLQDALSDLEIIYDSIDEMNIYDYIHIQQDVDEVYESIKEVIDR